ncbi:hypothetical protein EI982_04840 [Haloplanus rallus]|jgi:hypothetical protein|uniref:Uncharacterized protein n=1 Tax=Haloplanus rallus TaxID=1816183 RepID=A0A6B9F1N2_9EURY|nr:MULTISPECIES: hypothetical protein [Haloplanus]QGX94156.1 hypothetical protein EI982_04840 [Haloplanus rallus]
MDLDRAAKFGSVGAIGVVLVALGTVGLMRLAWTERISGAEGMAVGTVVIVGIAGTAITILFLFVVIGAFLDRELEARELGDPEE